MAATRGSVPAASRRVVSSRIVGGWLIAAGLACFCAALVWYLAASSPRMLAFPTDLTVYRDAGLIVRHVRPLYDPRRASPLYDWPGPHGRGLRFTYPPFAALPFALLSYLSLHVLGWVFALADLAAVPTAIWIILGALGLPRGRRRVGMTLLATVAALLTEPVLRTLALGQVEILLMLLVVWDLCQPEGRRWQGAGVGLAAGIKLVPLIFIPYLLVTRRFRQASVAAGAFAATVVIGFIALPRDSTQWWLHGLFMRESYGRNLSYAGNQSLMAIIARAGSLAWHADWLAAAAVTGVLGLTVAALLDQAGERVLGLLTCALTSLLISPISWDHHWVWITLAVPVLAYYTLQTSGLRRWAWIGLAILVEALFAAWPTALWGEARDPAGWNMGLIWAPPNGAGREAGWHGFQLIVGNTYVLTGLALLLALTGAALMLSHARRTADSRRPLPG